ncbi:MAG: phytochelatin synthase family protein [Pseudomonadota bacterium]
MKYIFRVVFILLFLTANSFADDQQITVRWNSVDGLKRLQRAEYKNDFYELANYFQPQLNPLYCAAASSVIILNAIAENGNAPSQKNLEITTPKVLGGKNIEFKSYSQLTFFNDKTDKIKDRKTIELKNINPETENSVTNFDPGLTLSELQKILSKVYDLKAKIKYLDNVDEKTISQFRNIVKQIVADDTQYLLVNFNGKAIGLKTNGHISPVVAFDSASDSVLIMDVAGHKNGWYWVGVVDLVKAMNTKDGKNYRGYLAISK